MDNLILIGTFYLDEFLFLEEESTQATCQKFPAINPTHLIQPFKISSSIG